MKFDVKFKERITGVPLQLIDAFMISSRSEPCMICKEPTVFIDYCSEGRLCSDECDSVFYSKVEESGGVL